MRGLPALTTHHPQMKIEMDIDYFFILSANPAEIGQTLSSRVEASPNLKIERPICTLIEGMLTINIRRHSAYVTRHYKSRVHFWSEAYNGWTDEQTLNVIDMGVQSSLSKLPFPGGRRQSKNGPLGWKGQEIYGQKGTHTKCLSPGQG